MNPDSVSQFACVRIAVNIKVRVLSLLLCFVMALSLVVPAFAADANDAMVIIYQDGRQVDADARNSSGTKDIMSIGAKDIDRQLCQVQHGRRLRYC